MRLQFLVEEQRHIVESDVLGQKCCTYAAQQKEGQGARIHLLVVQHVVGEIAARTGEPQGGDLGGKAGGVHRAGESLGRVLAQ